MHFSFFTNSRWDPSVPKRGTSLASGESLALLHLARGSWTKTTVEQYGHDGRTDGLERFALLPGSIIEADKLNLAKQECCSKTERMDSCSRFQWSAFGRMLLCD